MGSKEWIFQNDAHFGFSGIYQEASSSEQNNNPVILEVNPAEAMHSLITVSISADELDQIAIAWCLKRGL